jgi:hypothetical protein
VQELGGSLIRQPSDTPYGRMAGAVDPLGAALKSELTAELRKLMQVWPVAFV